MVQITTGAIIINPVSTPDAGHHNAADPVSPDTLDVADPSSRTIDERVRAISALYAASIVTTPRRGLSLLQIRDFVTRQWRLVALITALAIIVEIAYLALTPRKYTAQTDMIIDTKRVTFSQSELATENRIVEDASVESEIETTKSEKVAGVVAKRLQRHGSRICGIRREPQAAHLFRWFGQPLRPRNPRARKSSAV